MGEQFLVIPEPSVTWQIFGRAAEQMIRLVSRLNEAHIELAYWKPRVGLDEMKGADQIVKVHACVCEATVRHARYPNQIFESVAKDVAERLRVHFSFKED